MEVDQPQIQSLPPDIIIAKMSCRKGQWSPSRRVKMSSPKLPQALFSISLHTTTQGNPEQLMFLPQAKNPQAGKGDVTLARPSTASLQSIKQSVKQFAHLKACVSSFLTCFASSHSRHGGQRRYCPSRRAGANKGFQEQQGKLL